MKKVKSLFVMTVLFLMVTVCVPVHGATDTAAQTTKKVGLVKVGSKYCYFDKKGNKRKNCWKSVNGSKYYFNANGYAATGGTKIGNYVYVFRPDGSLVRPSKKSLQNVGKYTYYVDKKGRATIGWFTIGSKLYRADAKGRLTKSKTIEGIVLTKKGYAKTNTASRLKKVTMSIVSQITRPTMSKSEKLRACWNYVTNRGRFRYVTINPNFNKKGWQRELAYTLLNSGIGDCYGFACGFAALAREVGYNPVVVLGRVSGTRDGAADGLTRHGWVEINGLTYDPEAQWMGWFPGVYGSGSYNISHTIQNRVKFASDTVIG